MLTRILQPSRSGMGLRWVSVISEKTPNPESYIFYVGKGDNVLGTVSKSLTFTDRYKCSDSPLAAALFKVHGVGSVLLGPKHLTVSKQKEFDWGVVKPSVELVIQQFFDSGMPIVRPGLIKEAEPEAEKPVNQDEFMTELLELLEERVRPFVQQDGGDIEFVGWEMETGTVKLRMQGSCVGCPKSQVTLKMGIQRMLKHYLPQIKEVVNVDDEGNVSEAPAEDFSEDPAKEAADQVAKLAAERAKASKRD